MTEAKPSGRRWPVIAICIVLLPIAGWCAFWLYLRTRADAELTALARAAADSPVKLTCGGRTINGFPFDLVVTCHDPATVIAGDKGPVDIRFPRFVAQVSLFSPQNVALDLTGPLTAQDAAGRTQATWTTMRAEINGVMSGVRDLAIHGSYLGLTCEACYEPLRASHVDTLDIRFGRRDATQDHAFSVSAAGLQNALLLALTASDKPANFATTGTITKFAFPESLRLAAAAERWRFAGGNVTFDNASLDQGPMHVQVAGTFALDEYHRPAGTFQVGARNAATLISVYTRSLSPLLQLAIGAALRGLDSATANSGEKLDVSLPGRIENGSLSLGPLRGIATVPPLY